MFLNVGRGKVKKEKESRETLPQHILLIYLPFSVFSIDTSLGCNSTNTAKLLHPFIELEEGLGPANNHPFIAIYCQM